MGLGEEGAHLGKGYSDGDGRPLGAQIRVAPRGVPDIVPESTEMGGGVGFVAEFGGAQVEGAGEVFEFSFVRSLSTKDGVETAAQAGFPGDFFAGGNKPDFGLLFQVVPLAELGGKATRNASTFAGGGANANAGTATDGNIGSHKLPFKRHIFQIRNARHTTDSTVGARGEAQTGSEKLEMAGPGVAGLRVEFAFELGSKKAIGGIAQVGFTRFDVTVSFDQDTSADGIGSRTDFAFVGP